MKFFLLASIILICRTALAGPGIIAAPGSQNSFFQDNLGRIFPSLVILTTDGLNNVLPFNQSTSIGNVPSGSVDSGNPVKVGGVYNSTTPVLSNLQRGNLQIDQSGDLKVTTDSHSFNENGNAYSSDTDSVLLGTTVVSFYYLNNPIGSGKNLLVKTVMVGGDGGIFRVYKDPVVTVNGTPLGIVNNNMGSVNISVASAFIQPTTTSNGTLLKTYFLPKNLGYQQDEMTSLLIIQPGHGLLVTVSSLTNNSNTIVYMGWSEQ